MPKAFERCVANGGRVRTVSGPNKEHGLSADEHVKYCTLNGETHRGEVKKKKQSDSADSGELDDTVLLSEARSPVHADSSVEVDRKAGVVRNVPLLGARNPSRQRTYLPDTLKRATTLYEGVPYYVDTGNHENPDAASSPLNLIGRIEAPHFADSKQQIRGDVRPISKMADWFFDLAEQMPEVVGNSPVQRGKAERTNDGEQIVHDIVEVRRVDLVSRPGTVSGLHDSEEDSDMQWEDITLADLRAERPDIAKELLDSVSTDKDGAGDGPSAAEVKELQEQIKAKETKVKKLKKQVTDLQDEKDMQAKRAKADELLAESDLPEDAISDDFRDLVRTADDEEAMEALIKDRKDLVEGVRNKPKSYEKTVTDAEDDDAGELSEDALVDAIKG